MNKHEILSEARKRPRDEFYTLINVIENELQHYDRELFKDKTVLCNCDDDENSKFFEYFKLCFGTFGLKKLIGTHYEEDKGKPSYKIEFYMDTNNDGKVDAADGIIKSPILSDKAYKNRELLKAKAQGKNEKTKINNDEKLYSAGDFRSKDCIELLKEADIVCTNPPFSLFREYIAQLIEYNKKFLIIGNANAIGYKEIFPLFKDNKIWLGASTSPHPTDDRKKCNSVMKFCVSGNYEAYNKRSSSFREDENGNKYVKVSNIRWFTNLPVKCKKRCLDTRAVYYTPEKYPKYDNHNTINVNKTTDIPLDTLA